MAAQVDSPPTPVLECAYEHIGDPRRHWKLALKIYHGVLIAVVVVALAILIMVQAEIVNVGDTDDKDDWVEISSQIINGVFAWMAITSQPFYIYRLALTSKVLKATGEHWSGEKTSSIRAACYLSRHFSFVFVDSSTVCGNNVNDSEARNIRDNSDINGNLSAENGVVNVGNIIFLRNDARYLKTIFIILNCGCLFPYIMSGYMWGYDESSRPGFILPALLPPAILFNVIGQYVLYQLEKRSTEMTAYMWSYNAMERPGFVMPALLPPTILCNVIGQYRVKQLSKRGESRQMILADGVPVFRELSITRNSEPST